MTLVAGQLVKATSQTGLDTAGVMAAVTQNSTATPTPGTLPTSSVAALAGALQTYLTSLAAAVETGRTTGNSLIQALTDYGAM